MHRVCISGWRSALAGTIVLGLAACSSVQVRHPDGTSSYMSKDEFAHYVEDVFRLHNSTVNDLIIATSLVEDGELEAVAAWEEAEDDMTDACAPLIDAVTANIEHRALGFFEKLRLPEAVPACEAECRKLKVLLPANPL